MDYGKFRYEEAQRLKESRKKTVQITMKEVKFKPKIAKGDFDTKVRHMLEFLDEGHKVKVTLQFRGREMAHPELGSKILDAVIEQLGPIAKVDTSARLEGRNMTMVLSPDKKAAKRPASPKPAATKPTSVNPTPIKQDNSITTTEMEPKNAEDENIRQPRSDLRKQAQANFVVSSRCVSTCLNTSRASAPVVLTALSTCTRVMSNESSACLQSGK